MEKKRSIKSMNHDLESSFSETYSFLDIIRA